MKKFVIGNLKMNLQSIKERDSYLVRMSEELRKTKIAKVEMVLCAPFVHLEGFKKWKNKKIKRGAQDIFWEEKGSFTGEISPLMLKNLDCEYVIVGHSERRRYFGETGAVINGKIQAALKAELSPVLCVGETLEEKEQDLTMQVITNQVKDALQAVGPMKVKRIIIAYEPIWSIGTDMVPSSNDIMGAKLLIRKILHELVGKKSAEEVPILYGGNVNAKTVRQVCLEAEMDGVLVGRDSLIPTEFVKIAEAIENNC